jgi:hypothetical protein
MWADFQRQLPSSDATDALLGRLVRLAREVSELDESVEYAEVLRDVDAPTAMRKRIGHDLQTLKRELWHLRLCPPFGTVAERINQGAESPVPDG